MDEHAAADEHRPEPIDLAAQSVYGGHDDTARSLDEARRNAIAAYRAHLEITARLIEMLTLHKAATEIGLENFQAGGGSAFEPMGRPAAEARVSLTDVLADFERSRRNSRLATIDVALSEGRSLSDIARHWGVSRQYLWKLTRDDARLVHPTDD